MYIKVEVAPVSTFMDLTLPYRADLEGRLEYALMPSQVASAEGNELPPMSNGTPARMSIA